MNRPTCTRPMIALFINFVCDFCNPVTKDGATPPAGLEFGYVVWRERPMPAQEYVFPSTEHAERWRGIQGLNDCDIRKIATHRAFKWRKSSGSIKNLEMADHLYEIYLNNETLLATKDGSAYRAYLYE